MSLVQYKCEICNLIEDYVYLCRNNHLTCEECAQKVIYKCRCKEALENRTQNPLLMNLKENCPYISKGCKLTIVPGEMQQHVEECRYRPYKCIGISLGVWSQCNWGGLQMEFEKHIRDDHDLGEFFKHFHEASVPFHNRSSRSSFNLINAFSRRFVFYYNSNVKTKMVIFIVFLLGRKDDARNYFVEFECRSPTEDSLRKIKFVTDCYSDSEDISKIIMDEKCIALSYRTAKNYLKADHIHYRFIVKQKSKDVNALSAAAAASSSSSGNANRSTERAPIFQKSFKKPQMK